MGFSTAYGSSLIKYVSESRPYQVNAPPRNQLMKICESNQIMDSVCSKLPPSKAYHMKNYVDQIGNLHAKVEHGVLAMLASGRIQPIDEQILTFLLLLGLDQYLVQSVNDVLDFVWAEGDQKKVTLKRGT